MSPLCDGGRRQDGWVKRHLSGHPFPVLVSQVSVNLADQDAPVPVPDPGGNGHEVHARHNAHADEVMPAIVKLKVWQQIGRAHV